MPFHVYIIYSPSLDQYYVGHTENLPDRIFRHKNSGSKSTKTANGRVLKFTEEFAVKSEAMKRELEIKSKKSRKYIKRLLDIIIFTQISFSTSCYYHTYEKNNDKVTYIEKTPDETEKEIK